jgi:hypothetical protein
MILHSSRGVETHGQEAAGSWQQAVDISHLSFYIFQKRFNQCFL